MINENNDGYSLCDVSKYSSKQHSLKLKMKLEETMTELEKKDKRIRRLERIIARAYTEAGKEGVDTIQDILKEMNYK
jgi:ABC-type phosphate/phosphonate transport system substrate-binding protein